MKSISEIILFLSITIFIGVAVAADKVVVIPLIEGAPNTNSALFIKSNGQKIGVLDQMNDLGDGSFGQYSGLSFKEYHFKVRRQSGMLSPRSLVFTTNDCTGQAYSKAADEFDPAPGPFTESQGRVFSSPPGYSLPVYYVSRGTTSEVITARSSWTDSTPEPCISMNKELPVYSILPNDPGVTGVQNSYALPIYAGF